MSGEETELTGSEAPTTGRMGDPFDGAGLVGGDEDPFADDACQLVPDDEDASQVESAQVSGVMEIDSTDSTLSESGAARGEPAVAEPPARHSAGLSAMSKKLAALAKPEVSLQPGQRVRHAEYGDGLLEKIGGSGPRMVGTVIFDGAAGRRTFILTHATLEPLS